MATRGGLNGGALPIASSAPTRNSKSPSLPGPPAPPPAPIPPRSCPRSRARYAPAIKLAFKLLHTRYRVEDLDRSVAFYTTVLGLEEIQRKKSPRGSELVFLKAPESEETIELCSFPASGPVQVQADLTHVAFQVESLAAFEQHLARHGLKFSDGPHMKPDGSGFAFIDAPEGYEIELIQRSAGPTSTY